MTNQKEKEYRPPIMKRVGGVLVFMIGLATAAFTLYFAAKDLPLWVFGKHTQAEVTKIWYEQTSQATERPEGIQDFLFYISYQFTTPNGKVVTGKSKTSAVEWSSMWEGLKIDIVYFPLYPRLNRLDDSSWVLFLSCSYVPLLVISFIGFKLGRYLLTSP